MARRDNKPWEAKWQKINCVGSGGQGSAHLCVSVDPQDETKYIIKLLHKQKDLERRARMHREVTTLLTLLHPNILKYVDGNTHEFNNLDIPLYFVSEYIPGQTLKQRINEKHLTIDEALCFTFKLLEALDYCHSDGIVHRDIKPSNIILRDNSLTSPILIDFGLTFNWEENKNEQITQTNQHLGNRFLFLPEQHSESGNKRDARSDITVCCGILLYTLTNIQPSNLQDEHGNKPHQRTGTKILLEEIERERLNLLNYLFDIGFETKIDYRWQSIAALKDKLLKIQNVTMEATTGKNSEAEIQEIREKIQSRAGYQQTIDTQKILHTVDRLLQKVHMEVLAALGSDFINHQGGYRMDVANSQFTNMLGIIESTNHEKGFKPYFKARITGTELIIIAEELERETSLFREPTSKPIPWEDLKVRVKKYFSSGVNQSL